MTRDPLGTRSLGSCHERGLGQGAHKLRGESVGIRHRAPGAFDGRDLAQRRAMGRAKTKLAPKRGAAAASASMLKPLKLEPPTTHNTLVVGRFSGSRWQGGEPDFCPLPDGSCEAYRKRSRNMDRRL